MATCYVNTRVQQNPFVSPDKMRLEGLSFRGFYNLLTVSVPRLLSDLRNR